MKFPTSRSKIDGEARTSISIWKMSAADTFIYFQALPLELRLQIWEEALSAWTVWAAVPCYVGVEHCLKLRGLRFRMVLTGPAPFLIAGTCKEARRLLEQCYIKPIRAPSDCSATSTGAYWVNLETTVVHLGNASEALYVLPSFGKDDLSRFKHVAVWWDHFESLSMTCYRLATQCPVLRTVIIQYVGKEGVYNCSSHECLSLGAATYYATTPEFCGSGYGFEKLDVPRVLSALRRYFSDPPPRLHLVDPTSTSHLS